MKKIKKYMRPVLKRLAFPGLLAGDSYEIVVKATGTSSPAEAKKERSLTSFMGQVVLSTLALVNYYSENPSSELIYTSPNYSNFEKIRSNHSILEETRLENPSQNLDVLGVIFPIYGALDVAFNSDNLGTKITQKHGVFVYDVSVDAIVDTYNNGIPIGEAKVNHKTTQAACSINVDEDNQMYGTEVDFLDVLINDKKVPNDGHIPSDNFPELRTEVKDRCKAVVEAYLANQE